MAWQDTLHKLREELAGDRSERQQQAATGEEERRRQQTRLTEFAASWEIPALLAEMNRILLDGRGQVENLTSWEADADEDPSYLDDLADEEETDFVTALLSWDEQGGREIAVDLGRTGQGFYLQVNGADVRLERGALERALVEAFREELDL
jgi:hypothetical protein